MKKHLSILFLFLSITFSFAQNIPAKIYPKYDIANKNPLQTMLGANEVFTAGDFPVTVISAQGSNGIYSGTGYIVVPYLADTKIKVSFNNIKLNTDKKLIEGVVETTYDVGESNIVDGGLFDFLDKAITDNYTITNDAIRQGFFYQNSFDVIINNQTAINSIIAPYITNLTNLGLISTELKKQIEDEQKKQNDLLKGLDCPKKSDSENKGEGNKQQTEEPTKPKGSNDDVRVVETDCEKKLKEYQQSQQQILDFMKQAQKEAVDKIITGKAFPPKYTEAGSSPPPKPITASRLREIQAHCEDGALGFWKAQGFTKVENNGNPYYYCLSGTDVFYHYKQPTDTYGYENYWFVDGNWYMEGTSQQCGSTPFNCFLVYDTVTKNYVLANLVLGESTGEQTADFLTWLFVRDMPLTIIGGGGSATALEAVITTATPAITSYLSYTDKITDEQAMAIDIASILVGKMTNLNAEKLENIKKLLTEKIAVRLKDYAKQTGKNIKQIAEDLKGSIEKVAGKTAGFFTPEQIEYYVNFATKQGDKNKVMLGMWDNGGASSYITKAGKEYTFFDFGDKWSEATALVNNNKDEIWKINKKFIDNQYKAGKEFWFSHDPYSPRTEQYFSDEVSYLIDLGVKDFKKVGDLWKAVW